jgi:MFS family permease
VTGSAWDPFRNRMYRALWLAQFVANTGTWAQTVGAQWLMGDLGGGPFEIALVQVAMTLPVFLLVVPAGALGDILDRRRLLLSGQSLMFSGAAGLALVTANGQAMPVTVLGMTAAMAVGQALCLPSFQAIQSELVPLRQIPQAALLNGANANVGRAVGPAVGGLLIAAAGPAAAFAFNAASFLGVLLVLLMWRRSRDHRPLGTEHVLAATKAGARYIRDDPMFAAVLGRSALFMVFASALWALLPAVARGPLGLDADGYGLLLAGLGIGAVFGTVVIVRLRRLFGVGFVATSFSVAYAVAMVGIGFSARVEAAVALLVIGGMAWVAVQSTFNAAAQVLLPEWTRARGLAYFQLVFMGCQAFGALGWGALADLVSLPVAMAIPSVGLVFATAVGAWRLTLPDKELDLAPVQYWPQPVSVVDPDSNAGPVLVTVEWPVQPDKSVEFVAAMRPVGRSRKRTGATMWGLFRDIDDPAVFVETFVVATWHEHLRQHLERGTVLDQRTEAYTRTFLVPDRTPKIRHFLWAVTEAAPQTPPEPAKRESPHAD